MLPLRLVLDTNVIVSAALKADGLQRTVFLLAITKPARLCVSPEILSEYRDVLSRPELSIRKGLRLQFLELIKNHSRVLHPARSIHITSDPDQQYFHRVRRCGARGLSRHRKSSPLSQILEKHENRIVP